MFEIWQYRASGARYLVAQHGAPVIAVAVLLRALLQFI
jgi:hypothetical protein